MVLTIKYFGMVAERTGRKQEELHLDEDACDLEALKSWWRGKYGLSNDMNSVQIAVNHALTDTCTLQSGDEVAFLPPFAGG